MDALLHSVFTARYPEWNRFRGAWYRGVATHDPLEHALVAHMLSRASLLPELPHWVRMYIARLACSGEFPSSKTHVLRSVCKVDAACTRLLHAACLSMQLRRLFNCIPRGCTLWGLYRSWTHEVACAIGAIPVQRTISLGTDPCAASLATANRLHIRGFECLGFLYARPAVRPAYIPTAAQVQSWTQQLQNECSRDAVLNTAAHLTEQGRRSDMLIQHEVYRGGAIPYKKDMGCFDLVLQHTETTALYYKKMYLATVQHTLLELAARLYVRVNRLGLNAAERDYFFMLSAAEHDNTP